MNFENLKNFMDFLTKWRMPGNSVCVYYKNKKVYSYQSGFADVENKKAMTQNELLNIYSCSKVATVTAALSLYEKGKFLLDDPLYEYISEFKDMVVKDENGNIEKAKSPITIRNLFTMTAGFDYDISRPAFEEARKMTNGKMNTLTVAKCLAKEPLCFEPGSRWGYSVAHDVLAAFVEVVSGKKFRDYVKESIFEPLEMKNSYYHADDEILKRMAQQYEFVDFTAEDKQDLVAKQKAAHNGDSEGYIKNVGKNNAHVLGSEYDSGGAGIITTVGDYAKLATALANYGIGANGERILARGTVNLMRQNQLNENLMNDFSWEQHKGYGYGLGVRTLTDIAQSGTNGNLGEFGWGGAAGATIISDPESSIALFYAHHMLNPQEAFYQPRLRNVLYSCLD